MKIAHKNSYGTDYTDMKEHKSEKLSKRLNLRTWPGENEEQSRDLTQVTVQRRRDKSYFSQPCTVVKRSLTSASLVSLNREEPGRDVAQGKRQVFALSPHDENWALRCYACVLTFKRALTPN
ncbi:hypothetical protein RRG08_036058 [Elysia crispata]|uniref:Uncharacterized protein n=1 Tax=Elysia crispata TaxID=231223 RepID=A0AAE1E155_9GAST|nr:hypothetical protein RRG08_036058 [Elysia crispata]